MKRKSQRYPIKQEVSVLFKKSSMFSFIKPRTVQKGALIDFSATGIRAEYEAATVWSSNFDKMSIFTIDNKFSIENIPCKIISDRIVYRSSNGTCLRRCGLKFGDLSNNQKVQLSNFMKAYSTHPLG